jgi:ferritin-like metal-binding protein YciE
MKTLADAFEPTLQDVCCAEHAIIRSYLHHQELPAVSNGDPKTALMDHLTETKGQIKTLEAVSNRSARRLRARSATRSRG